MLSKRRVLQIIANDGRVVYKGVSYGADNLEDLHEDFIDPVEIDMVDRANVIKATATVTHVDEDDENNDEGDDEDDKPLFIKKKNK